MDLKSLKKLAAACRAAGIQSFKNADCEFTLAVDAPISNYKKKKVEVKEANIIDESFKSDSLTEEQLLMWSSVDLNEESTPESAPN